MLREFSGNAKPTTLAGAVSAAATSLTVADGTGYPTGAVGPFVITVDSGLASEEKVLCSTRTGNTLSVSSRGWDGTTAADHDNQAVVEHTFSATDAREANLHVNQTGVSDDPHPQYLTAGEGVGKALVDAKGDLIVGSAADTVVRLPVGADTQVLTADATTASGVAWKAAGGGYVTSAAFPAVGGGGSNTTNASAGNVTVPVVTGRRYAIRFDGTVFAQQATVGNSPGVFLRANPVGTPPGTFLGAQGPIYAGYELGSFVAEANGHSWGVGGTLIFTATSTGTLTLQVRADCLSGMTSLTIAANAFKMLATDLGAV